MRGAQIVTGARPIAKLIVSARTPGAGPNRHADLVVMRADGTRIRAITRDRALGELARLGTTLNALRDETKGRSRNPRDRRAPARYRPPGRLGPPLVFERARRRRKRAFRGQPSRRRSRLY